MLTLLELIIVVAIGRRLLVIIEQLQIIVIKQHVIHILFHIILGVHRLLFLYVFKLHKALIVVFIILKFVILAQKLVQFVHSVELGSLWAIAWALVILEID